MREMSIESIRASMVGYQRVVILKEKLSERYLPIWIGPAEAEAIAIRLQNVTTPRPLTHDLLSSIIKALGGVVNFVVVDDIRNDTFYAKVLITIDGKQIEIDSRPSDAIALAVRVEVPIYVEELVLDKSGVIFDRETGKPILASEAGKSGQEVSESELQNLSAFTDFIDTLNLDDLGKEKPKDEQ
jgi:hypothetical protein